MTKICKTKNNSKIIYKIISCKLFLTLAVMGCLLFGSLAPSDSYASDQAICTMYFSSPTGTWVDSPEFKVTSNSIISDIVLKIKSRLGMVASKMYGITIMNPQFVMALEAAVTLYIVVFGILFTSGMIQMKVYDFIIRGIKIGIIVMLTTPSSWTFFNSYVVTFFDQFTDNTIIFVTNSLPTSVPEVNSVTSGLTPVSAMDSVVGKVVSSKMFAALAAASLTNTYGPFYFLLLLLSILSFLRSVITAVWVYVMSLVMKALLYGLAPLFIPTILFQRTRPIFDGWVAQLVNATLQPVLLFIFFLFFVKLLEGSVDSILQVPICFSKLPEGMRGSGFDFSYWKFMDHSTGDWTINTKDFPPTKAFPISMISVLTFFAIAEISSRFNTIVIQVASQISQASTNLSTGIEAVFGVGQRVMSSIGKKD